MLLKLPNTVFDNIVKFLRVEKQFNIADLILVDLVHPLSSPGHRLSPYASKSFDTFKGLGD